MKQNTPSKRKSESRDAVPKRRDNTPAGGNTALFTKENYRLMLIGVIVMALGFVLMAGGRSSDPNVFDEKAIYSFTRITLAPILIVGGLVIEVFAIMKKTKEA